MEFNITLNLAHKEKSMLVDTPRRYYEKIIKKTSSTSSGYLSIQARHNFSSCYKLPLPTLIGNV